jgi:hypothetical protein
VVFVVLNAKLHYSEALDSDSVELSSVVSLPAPPHDEKRASDKIVRTERKDFMI